MPKHAQSINRKKILLLALGLLDPGPQNLKDYDFLRIHKPTLRTRIKIRIKLKKTNLDQTPSALPYTKMSIWKKSGFQIRIDLMQIRI